MTHSIFDLFTIGIGPSSSHTVGPMRAARQFATRLEADGLSGQTSRVRIELLGSLGATGRGHGTDRAVVLGLEGARPETIDIEEIETIVERARTTRTVRLLGRHPVGLEPHDLVFLPHQSLPFHPNAMTLTAFGARHEALHRSVHYSVGGGFVVDADDRGVAVAPADPDDASPCAYASAAELLGLCRDRGAPISDIVRANESAWRTHDEIRCGLDAIWQAMRSCVEAGCRITGTLPGGLMVPRRAPGLHRDLIARPSAADGLDAMDWVNLFALAVNEQNASGGRVVTAPTNGAAGVIPAVLHYYTRFVPGADDAGVHRFLLTAGGIGLLYKRNASISGSEVGCQGEVGSACSMAAGALCEVLGGTPAQVENAAEIGMEHNLGLTCDPVGGLVQIPCIERNAMAAVKAINAAKIALRGTGEHIVSLDTVIETMRSTGADMSDQYKETSRGGLAVNVVDC